MVEGLDNSVWVRNVILESGRYNHNTKVPQAQLHLLQHLCRGCKPIVVKGVHRASKPSLSDELGAAHQLASGPAGDAAK